ncbi:DUF1427 family protein [Streptomyces flavidovirens]|uniref:DUF1427 family protein n=1 Tax=Streptomyces flavidovirens TaxID=67298 RepID=UPI00040D2695|nr:DUF1427 family protein [Streptomyces flavidovirens]
MTAPRKARAAAFARRAGVSLLAGTVMGAVFWALDVAAPAPPLLSLCGLAGILLGERVATALRARWSSRRRRPAAPVIPTPSGGTRPESAPHVTTW